MEEINGTVGTKTAGTSGESPADGNSLYITLQHACIIYNVIYDFQTQ